MLKPLRIIIHLGCFLPFVWLCYVLYQGDETAFGADPIKEIEHFLGYTAIIIFCMMFALSILFQLLNKNQYQILRRPLGLWVFVWASLHIASYALLELGFDFSLFFAELGSRPYLIFGAIAFFILLIMALTSLPTIKSWLGGKQWVKIHQWGYFALILAFIHYYWSVKSLTLPPIMIGATVLLIFLWRYFGQSIFTKR